MTPSRGIRHTVSPVVIVVVPVRLYCVQSLSEVPLVGFIEAAQDRGIHAVGWLLSGHKSGSTGASWTYLVDGGVFAYADLVDAQWTK